MATDYQQQVFPLFVPATNTVDKNELIQMIKEVDPLTKDCSHGVEAREKAELKRRYGFKQPQALLGYSKDAKYKDLCVYFDLVDRKSAINEHISNVFSCYGVTGQTGAPHTVRGNAIVLRSEPPKMGHIGQMHFPFNPHIPIEEMVGTILFFRGKDVRALAHLRDAARFRGTFNKNASSQAYQAPGGTFVPADKINQVNAGCSQCGKGMGKAAGLLRQCPCHTASYCNKECQRAHWKLHKKTCSTSKK